MPNTIISAIQSAGRGFIDPTLEQQLHQASRRTEAAEQALAAFCLDKPMQGAAEQFHSLAAELGGAYEELGFSNGFRLAVRLMTECQ